MLLTLSFIIKNDDVLKGGDEKFQPWIFENHHPFYVPKDHNNPENDNLLFNLHNNPLLNHFDKLIAN